MTKAERHEAGNLAHEAPAGGHEPPLRTQLLVASLVLVVLVVDGIATQLPNFVAPILTREWGISKQAFAPAVTATYVGLTIGAFLGGAAGDLFGRRPMLIASVLSFAGGGDGAREGAIVRLGEDADGRHIEVPFAFGPRLPRPRWRSVKRG